MVTETASTAAENAIFCQDKQDKYSPSNMMLYRTSLALLKSLWDNGTFTESEYKKMRKILTKKYGLSSCSIFAEIA
ncbi:MAG: hypothetical protein IJ002_04895 [Clostridia bacterium]|nr:hypothetical protein [Clostridia bacterium]